MKKKIAYAAFAALMLAAPSKAYIFDEQQLTTAKSIAMLAEPICGVENCSLKLLSIAQTESSMGKHRIGDKGKNIYDASLGIFQIRLSTFYHVSRYMGYKAWQTMDRDDVVRRLLEDTVFQVHVAVVILEYHRTIHGTGWKPVYRWNGVLNKPYIDSIQKSLGMVYINEHQIRHTKVNWRDIQ